MGWGILVSIDSTIVFLNEWEGEISVEGKEWWSRMNGGFPASPCRLIVDCCAMGLRFRLWRAKGGLCVRRMQGKELCARRTEGKGDVIDESYVLPRRRSGTPVIALSPYSPLMIVPAFQIKLAGERVPIRLLITTRVPWSAGHICTLPRVSKSKAIISKRIQDNIWLFISNY